MKQHIIQLLTQSAPQSRALFSAANTIQERNVKNIVYLRGLIEYSNVCNKNCHYCGLRHSHSALERYTLTEAEVLSAAVFAWQSGFGSLVIQSGETQSPHFTHNITDLLTKIHASTNSELGITLSLGEQSFETLSEWRNAGATRYLLRIETSNPALYSQIHPADTNHSYANRCRTLEILKDLDYQVGTGVMIGLPGQTVADLADDLLFIQKMDIDMIGMGPYISHTAAPLYVSGSSFSQADKVQLTLKMTAVLRLMMPDINIAATTALQTLDSGARAAAISAGANVIMPNITPRIYRNNYLLYENKAVTDDILGEDVETIGAWCHSIGYKLGLNNPGNSIHYLDKKHIKSDS